MLRTSALATAGLLLGASALASVPARAQTAPDCPLLGIALYQLDENIRSSLVLGFVGAGGIGVQLLTAMNLFQYRTVSLLLLVTFGIVILAERLSAWLRRQLA